MREGLGELPVDWTWVTLDDLQADAPGAITDGPFGSNLTRAHYSESGARVVRLQNIGDGHFVDSEAHVPLAHFEKLRKHAVEPDDLLIASLGDVLPRACLAPAGLGPTMVKADCVRVRLGSMVDPRWVLYALQTPALRRWADDQVHGVGRPRLGLKVIRALPVPLPGIGEQRRIVDLLESHLSHLDAAGRASRSAEQRLVSLVPTSLDCALAFTRAEQVPLSELVDRVEAGRSFGSASRPADDDEWGIVKVSSMTWGEFRPQENKVVVDLSRVDARYEIRAGDLLLSRANTSAYVGAPVLVANTRPKLLLSDKSLRLRPRAGVDIAYLHAVMSAPRTRRQVSALATGTKDSMRNISQKALLQVRVPAANKDQQVEAVLAAQAARQAVSRLSHQLARIQRQRDALRRSVLTAAFDGRLTAASRPEDLAGV